MLPDVRRLQQKLQSLDISGDGPLVAQKAIISILKGSMDDVDIASQEVGVVSRVGDGIAYIDACRAIRGFPKGVSSP